MFSVIFEVHPKPNKWDAYLDNAKMLRPELEQVDGFIDNIRYKSLSRKGWILSLSGWRDEKSVVRWRTAMRHHIVQEKGRSEILLDYHLRVGQVIRDTHVPAGQKIEEQRLDETEIGEGTAVTFIDAPWPPTSCDTLNVSEAARFLGFKPEAAGLVSFPECPLLAQSGHGRVQCTCPLSGVKRICPLALHMSAFDPQRT